MMSVPLAVIIVSKCATTCQPTFRVAVILVTDYKLMGELVQVNKDVYSNVNITNTHTDVNECLTNNGGCAHSCTNSIGSYTCSCRTGYVLADDNHGCIDVDECLDPSVHACQHNCVNTDGSFHCTCNPGYTLDSNGKTCTGKD